MNCPKCGMENDYDSFFCKRCGFPLDEEVENYNLNTKVISTSEGYYVYFCGIYIPVLSDLSNNADLSFNNQDSLHANAQKFCSNYDSPASNAGKYKDLILSYNSSSKSWKFKSFEENEQTSE